MRKANLSVTVFLEKKNLNVRRPHTLRASQSRHPQKMAADRSRPVTSASSSVGCHPALFSHVRCLPARGETASSRASHGPGARVHAPGRTGAFHTAVGAGTTTKGEPHLVTLYAFSDFPRLYQHDGVRVFVMRGRGHARPTVGAWATPLLRG